MSTATVGRRLAGLPRLRLSSGRIVAALVIAAVLFLGWLWLRSSSLVAIRQVQVTGVAGADAVPERQALVNTALTMTTLDASAAKLERAVSSFPYVGQVTIATHFPHGISIALDEQLPVATTLAGGARVEVDGAGQPLPAAHAPGLPSVDSLAARGPLAVLGAAPYQLLDHITSAANSPDHGVIVQLRDGPRVYFGQPDDIGAKWRATVAVLASSASSGAAYVDVSDPGRPAAGT